ncbi:Hypothetical_protein [Hexamita inflata]|uniref:Hypothetical_protein n=1 Tax=Hexamita inflata TaxID=28002 RepID=A0AA86R018_9EUKA|nr:Hypothetical protein HINF_LOCUS56841 [Hexamita inflata]
MLDSPVPLLGFALQLLLGCSYWAGRFYSLCFKISSMFSIFQSSIYILLYSQICKTQHHINLLVNYISEYLWTIFCIRIVEEMSQSHLVWTGRDILPSGPVWSKGSTL